MDKRPIQLLEKDIENLFHKPDPKQPAWDFVWSAIKGVVTFGILFGAFFLLVNVPAYATKAHYFWNKYIIQAPINSDESLSLLEPLSANPNIRVEETTVKAPNGENLNEFLKKHIPNDYLYIPQIDVQAPVIWSSSPERIMEDLRNGVAHYGGTALPGENGNVFIAGHSSNYWWDPGQYKQIFVLLDKLKPGDRIYVVYKDQPYVYQVESTKVVKPDAIEVLNPTDHSVITLMTCTPVGTTLNRLIVQGRQIYPAPSAVTNTQTINPKNLPAIR